jgi:Uncharacterized conserved protein, contains double-stranded beta-helix domain
MSKINWDTVKEEQVNPKNETQIHLWRKNHDRPNGIWRWIHRAWHTHENEQITEVQQGTLRFWFDNDESNPIDLKAGDAIIIKGNRPHKALMIGKVIETDTFSPPRQDWIDGSDSYLRK